MRLLMAQRYLKTFTGIRQQLLRKVPVCQIHCIGYQQKGPKGAYLCQKYRKLAPLAVQTFRIPPLSALYIKSRNQAVATLSYIDLSVIESHGGDFLVISKSVSLTQSIISIILVRCIPFFFTIEPKLKMSTESAEDLLSFFFSEDRFIN